MTGTPGAEGDRPASGDQRPDSPPVAKGQDALAALFAQVRQIDPCALHSLDAAREATGLTPDSIMPDSGLNGCELEMTQDPTLLSVWSLQITVGRASTAAAQEGGTPEQLGEVTATKRLTGGKDDPKKCDYTVPLADTQPGSAPPSGQPQQNGTPGPGLEITLTVRHNGVDALPRPACEVAQGYLRAVGRYWKVPALRTDQLTTPQFDVARLDPCAGLTGLSADLGEVEAVLLQPHGCDIRKAGTGAPIGPGAISVKYALDSDPRTALGVPMPSREFRAVTVAGQPGVAATAKPSAGNPGGGSGSGPDGGQNPKANPKANPKTAGSDRCDVAVVLDEKLSAQPRSSKKDSGVVFPLIKAQAPTCELASKAIELARPGARPAPAPQADDAKQQRLAGRAPGSIALGDLNPPPSAAQAGAPFDPCALGWESLPPGEVRDPRNSAPERKYPAKDEKFDVICRYDNSPRRAVSLDPSAPKPQNSPETYMWVDVVWQEEPGGDPSGKKNADNSPVAPVDWPGGKRGYVQDMGRDDRFGPMCRAAVQLPKGVGAVYVANSAFPQVPACDIARSVATAIANASK